MRSNQPGLAFVKIDVGLCYLRATFAQALNFPPLKRQASFERILYEIVMARLSIGRDDVSGWVFGFRFAHVFVSNPAGASGWLVDYRVKALSGTRFCMRILTINAD